MNIKKIVYQIYPISFLDTTGNGKGDIKGIISKLDYLKDLGVDYLWLNPVFRSPFKDNGYDVSDYYNVDKKFGSNQDLKNLIFVAKEKGLKIMLDMVFNHTSIEHPWFKKWISGNKEYKDFYISKYSQGKPPTNWKSKFGGSAWREYKPNNWYLHLFDKTQADLNWANPKVREKLFEVIDYYVKLGVKGFRFDVINLISKSKYIDDKNGDGRAMYTDGPKVHEYIKMLAKHFPKNIDFLTVGELSSSNIKDAIQYSNKNNNELDSVFTFHHLKIDYENLNKFKYKEPDIKELNNVLKKWFTNMHNANSTMASFLNNHDQPRSVSRFINRKFHKQGAKMLFALMACLPGIPYIFQGEEIGMENADFKNINQFRDIETINFLKHNKLRTIPEGVYQKSRDNARTPMQWNDSKNAGFSKNKPWIDVNNNYKIINVKNEINDNDSILNFYKSFIKYIKTNEIQNYGNIKFCNYRNKIISFERTFKKKTLKHIFSFNDRNLEYNFKIDNIKKTNYINIEKNILKPYQFVILEKKWKKA